MAEDAHRLSVPTLFVTATDTEVGKTAVASALAALLRERGRDVGVMKPVASGCREEGGRWVSDDGLCLARAAAVGDPHELICPVRLRHPLAPMTAAELEGRAIDLSVVWEAAERLAAAHDCLIVEGIGGIMVPITPDVAVVDLAAAFGAPVLVVARAGLGTINHSLLTVEALRARGLRAAGVLLNACDADPGGPARETNPSILGRLSGVPVIGPLAHCDGVSVETGELGDLSAALRRVAGIDALITETLDL